MGKVAAMYPAETKQFQKEHFFPGTDAETCRLNLYRAREAFQQLQAACTDLLEEQECGVIIDTDYAQKITIDFWICKELLSELEGSIRKEKIYE